MAVLVVTRSVAALVAAAAVLAARPCWAQERISVQDFKAGIEHGLYDVVFDVRSQDEWDTGHIPGAIHFPLDAMDDDRNWHSQHTALHEAYSCDKSCATIVTYCAVGGRASTAIHRLRELGFQGTLLNGQGTSQWVAAGYELTQDDDDEEDTAITTTECATRDICPANDEPTAASEQDAPLEESSSSVSVWGVATAMLATTRTTTAAAALLLLPSSLLLALL